MGLTNYSQPGLRVEVECFSLFCHAFIAPDTDVMQLSAIEMWAILANDLLEDCMDREYGDHNPSDFFVGICQIF
jgi:hypothetical protein